MIYGLFPDISDTIISASFRLFEFLSIGVIRWDILGRCNPLSIIARRSTCFAEISGPLLNTGGIPLRNLPGFAAAWRLMGFPGQADMATISPVNRLQKEVLFHSRAHSGSTGAKITYRFLTTILEKRWE